MNLPRATDLAVVAVTVVSVGLVGCGGGNSVVTVTTTETHVETIANASDIPNQMTASDEKIATLVRDQADEVESLSTDLANGSLKTDPQGTYTRVSML